MYIQCIYGASGRESTKYTVKYNVRTRFWPTLAVTYRSTLTEQSGIFQLLIEHTHTHTHTHTPVLQGLQIKPSVRVTARLRM